MYPEADGLQILYPHSTIPLEEKKNIKRSSGQPEKWLSLQRIVWECDTVFSNGFLSLASLVGPLLISRIQLMGFISQCFQERINLIFV